MAGVKTTAGLGGAVTGATLGSTVAGATAGAKIIYGGGEITTAIKTAYDTARSPSNMCLYAALACCCYKFFSAKPNTDILLSEIIEPKKPLSSTLASSSSPSPSPSPDFHSINMNSTPSHASTNPTPAKAPSP